jgi:hypothetical protein
MLYALRVATAVVFVNMFTHPVAGLLLSFSAETPVKAFEETYECNPALVFEHLAELDLDSLYDLVRHMQQKGPMGGMAPPMWATNLEVKHPGASKWLDCLVERVRKATNGTCLEGVVKPRHKPIMVEGVEYWPEINAFDFETYRRIHMITESGNGLNSVGLKAWPLGLGNAPLLDRKYREDMKYGKTSDETEDALEKEIMLQTIKNRLSCTWSEVAEYLAKNGHSLAHHSARTSQVSTDVSSNGSASFHSLPSSWKDIEVTDKLRVDHRLRSNGRIQADWIVQMQEYRKMVLASDLPSEVLSAFQSLPSSREEIRGKPEMRQLGEFRENFLKLFAEFQMWLAEVEEVNDSSSQSSD